MARGACRAKNATEWYRAARCSNKHRASPLHVLPQGQCVRGMKAQPRRGGFGTSSGAEQALAAQTSHQQHTEVPPGAELTVAFAVAGSVSGGPWGHDRARRLQRDAAPRQGGGVPQHLGGRHPPEERSEDR